MRLAAEGRLMYEVILQKAASDAGLSRLISTATEYAGMYALSRNRQKGCDGMGEAATLKEEFRTALEDLMRYCVELGYIPDDMKSDPDLLAREFMRRNHEI